MNMSSQQGEMRLPRNSTYVGGNGHDHELPLHNYIIPYSGAQLPSSGLEDHQPYNKVVRYRECLKNHAAAMGGNATDGCGEFMACGEEGTLEALKCSACDCHRNFHRKEIEGECSSDCYHSPLLNNSAGTKLILGHHKVMGVPEPLGYPTRALISSSTATPDHRMIMSYKMGSIASESDDQQEDGGGGVARPISKVVKKRFRTKFTQEQKEKMWSFAEKAGWRIQKQEESVVQQFCQEIGIKRSVLKVWMHNNKHNLAKKNNSTMH